MGWICRPFPSLVQVSQVCMACVPCPGEELDHSHALWTSHLKSLRKAILDYSGISPCLKQSESRTLPLSGKIQFQTSFLTHFEELPFRDLPHISLLLRGFISSLPSLFHLVCFSSQIFACPPFLPPFNVGLSLLFLLFSSKLSFSAAHRK